MIRTRIARAALVGGLSLAALAAGAGAAFAQQPANGTIAPGNELCTASQFANYQVRGVLNSASGQGVKLKLKKGTTVVENTSGRVNGPATLQELPPTFSGPGYYSFCASNTGTAGSAVSMVLLTDAEVH